MFQPLPEYRLLKQKILEAHETHVLTGNKRDKLVLRDIERVRLALKHCNFIRRMFDSLRFASRLRHGLSYLKFIVIFLISLSKHQIRAATRPQLLPVALRNHSALSLNTYSCHSSLCGIDTESGVNSPQKEGIEKVGHMCP
jgi:hypothetical protein